MSGTETISTIDGDLEVPVWFGRLWRMRAEGIAKQTQEIEALRARVERLEGAAKKAKAFLKVLSYRTGVDQRFAKDGYKVYEALRDALTPTQEPQP